MSEKNQKVGYALDLFSGNHNCAQSVLMSYANEYGLEHEIAIEVAAGFGGGMGRLQETCGAVTGAFMVIGLHFSRMNLDDDEKKDLIASRIQEFAAEFEKDFGSLKCLDILGYNIRSDEGSQQAIEDNAYQEKCTGFIIKSMNLLDYFLGRKKE